MGRGPYFGSVVLPNYRRPSGSNGIERPWWTSSATGLHIYPRSTCEVYLLWGPDGLGSACPPFSHRLLVITAVVSSGRVAGRVFLFELNLGGSRCTGWRAIAGRVEAIALRLGLEAIAIRLEVKFEL